MKTKRLLHVLIVIFAVAVTARWWLPFVLTILSVNSDLIQALDSSIGIISSLIAALSAIGSFILWQDQKKPETETLDQRNRRILLNHVENFWVKGVLEKSLHGTAMLELGIKEDPEAVTYPWAIKKEATDETLPAGTSMLEIFEQVGMGRSLLILGAPGSGKTTMLLELARQLIERARQNEAEPIPMVFNLASWTEKLTLADWLAQELNNIYYVPRKTAPDWVKGNKLLLLLDGLDEVRQESRAQCVDAINHFRKEHGLTSLAVCSRSQDYEELGAKLAFEGAIEIQPLTQKQVNEFFNRFGKEMAGPRSVLKNDSALREMAETPLFLTIMLMAYQNKQVVEILASGNENAQHKHLFDNYIERMFERPHAKNGAFPKRDVLHWLSWLAGGLIAHNTTHFLLENLTPSWIRQKGQIKEYGLIGALASGLIFGLVFGVISGWVFRLIGEPIFGLFFGLAFGIVDGLTIGLSWSRKIEITTVDSLSFNLKEAIEVLGSGLLFGLMVGWILGGLVIGLILGLFFGLVIGLAGGLTIRQTEQPSFPGQRLIFTWGNFLVVSITFWLIVVLSSGLIGQLLNTQLRWLIEDGLFDGMSDVPSIELLIEMAMKIFIILGLILVLNLGRILSINYGGMTLIQHYALRFVLAHNKFLSWKLIPFLDYCTDLIFLRRVGGGYIFVHRLLMEHFAAMYKE